MSDQYHIHSRYQSQYYQSNRAPPHYLPQSDVGSPFGRVHAPRSQASLGSHYSGMRTPGPPLSYDYGGSYNGVSPRDQLPSAITPPAWATVPSYSGVRAPEGPYQRLGTHTSEQPSPWEPRAPDATAYPPSYVRPSNVRTAAAPSSASGPRRYQTRRQAVTTHQLGNEEAPVLPEDSISNIGSQARPTEQPNRGDYSSEVSARESARKDAAYTKRLEEYADKLLTRFKEQQRTIHFQDKSIYSLETEKRDLMDDLAGASLAHSQVTEDLKVLESLMDGAFRRSEYEGEEPILDGDMLKSVSDALGTLTSYKGRTAPPTSQYSQDARPYE